MQHSFKYYRKWTCKKLQNVSQDAGTFSPMNCPSVYYLILLSKHSCYRKSNPSIITSWLISSFACLPLQCPRRYYAKHRWVLWFSSHLGFGAAVCETGDGNSNTDVATVSPEKPEQSSFTFIVWSWNSLGVISFSEHIWNFCTNLALLHHILNTFNMWQWFPLQVHCLGLL